MLQNYNKYKLLKVFLDSPLESFRLRELGRIVKIAPISVSNYLTEFIKKGLVRKYLKRNIPFYQSIRENPNFILYKKISILFELNNCGLVDYLWDTLSPVTIILFGSYARGESTEESDIDLFILGKEKELDLNKYEKLLSKKIHILFESNIQEVSKELKNNLINGMILKGYLKIE